MVVSFSFLSDALDSIDYTIKFQFFFQTIYRAYTIYLYKKNLCRGAHNCTGCTNPVEDREGDTCQHHY